MGLCRKKKYSPREQDDQRERTPSEKSQEEGKVGLKRNISLLQGVSIIVGVIVGSGIFVSPVGVLKHSGSVGVSLILWFVCGLFSALGAICYAELGVTIPRSGGEYIYVMEAFGPLPAFMILWINFICIGSVSNAANALIFATYVIKPFFPDCDPPMVALQLIAVLGITFLSIINCFNVSWAAKVAVLFTVTKISALLLVIVVGFIGLFQGKTQYLTNTFEGSSTDIGPFALAFYSGFWAFAGWNYLNFLVDELKNPVRNLPLAILISLTTVTVLYLLANVCYLTVLSPTEMLESSAAVAVVFADRTLGVMSWIMPVLVACSVFGTINSEIISMSRVFYMGALEGQLPSVVAMINYKYMTPGPAVLIMMIATVIFVAAGDIYYLIELSGLAFAVMLVAATGGLIYLRIVRPEIHRPIRLPLIFPIILFIWTIIIVVLTVYQQPTESLIGLAIFASAIPVYLVGVVWTNKPKSVTNFSESLTRSIQKMGLLVAPDS